MKGLFGSLVVVTSQVSLEWELFLHSGNKFFELNLESENIVLKGHRLSSVCCNKKYHSLGGLDNNLCFIVPEARKSRSMHWLTWYLVRTCFLARR